MSLDEPSFAPHIGNHSAAIKSRIGLGWAYLKAALMIF